jgi:hypothetical protein
LRRLCAAGLARIALLTGDRQANAEDPGILLRLDALWAGCDPVVAELLGGPEATQVMSRGHVEIERQARRLGRHLSTLDGIGVDQVDDLRATLYGLDAILALHFAQEEENYFTLAR